MTKLNLEPSLKDGFNWQSNIWRVKAPEKANFFLWRAAIKALPVGSALSARGLVDLTACKRCGEEESALHILFTCPFAIQVWDLAPVLFKPSVLQTTSVKLLLQESRRMVNLPPTGLSCYPLYPCLLWQLWKSRNRILFEDKRFSAQEICSKAISVAREWRTAQISTTTVLKPLLFTEEIHPPSEGVICRSDAAWDVISERCGLGWVFEDATTLLPLSKCSFSRQYVPSALAAEALAMEAAMKTAVRAGWQKVMFYSDSQQLVKLLVTEGSSTELSGILSNISLYCGKISSVVFGYIPCSKNEAANVLAKRALVALYNSSVRRG
ncbi:unnamed protein product [Microthlaspi erraticum]|uniref:RNase H type-1 domain-containing protein n=1 Tax=Microthlaspi erraticum TaxID=1685480 RepID=A0A6D2JW47_9BRAS|nr:unnamed protein product [Microthlaspi erraticum]